MPYVALSCYLVAQVMFIRRWHLPKDHASESMRHSPKSNTAIWLCSSFDGFGPPIKLMLTYFVEMGLNTVSNLEYTENFHACCLPLFLLILPAIFVAVVYEQRDVKEEEC